jgi:hypothetical protein
MFYGTFASASAEVRRKPRAPTRADRPLNVPRVGALRTDLIDPANTAITAASSSAPATAALSSFAVVVDAARCAIESKTG